MAIGGTWRRGAAAALAAVVVPGLLAAAGTAADPVFGYWLVENKEAIVEISPCADKACGTIVWLRRPGDPGAARRGRALCRVELIKGMRRRGAGAWTGGVIRDPRDGRAYSAILKVRGDGALELRGYFGLPLLGRSQVWTRAADDRGGC